MRAVFCYSNQRVVIGEDAMDASLAQPVLEGSTVRLRLVGVEDTPIIFSWLDAETLASLNLEDPVYFDLNGMPERLAVLLDRLERAKMLILMHKMLGPGKTPPAIITMYDPELKPVDVLFAITRKADCQLAGMIVLRVSLLNQVGTIRTVVAREWRRNHFGEEAKKLILEYAFRELELFKVCSYLLAHNAATRAMNTRLGFEIEAEYKEHVVVRGMRCTLFGMSLTRQKWLSLK